MKHCDEALKEITLAQDLNPLNIWVYSEAIAINIILERYDDALTWFNKGNIIEQNNFYLHRHLGRLYLKLGKYNDALIAFEKERDFAPDERYKKEGELDLHLTYAYSGEKKIAEKFLQKLIKENEQNKRDSSIPVYIATIYTALGDYTSAIEWLEKAYNVPKIYYSSSITKIYSYFEFDPLRSNPRFQALLKKMHFPEEKSLGK